MAELEKKPVKIVETVLRDAHQSLIATRLSTEQMLPIVDKMDKVGYHAVECWGGATFDASLRFLKEDPWERLIVVTDPMLATGGSAVAAVDFIKEHGGKNIKCMFIIAAPEGLERLHKAHPDVQIYVGHVDRELNENAYICPGLGDAGDRIFGTK